MAHPPAPPVPKTSPPPGAPAAGAEPLTAPPLASTPLTATPFVLLDDARGGGTTGGRARIYRAPTEVVVARRAEEVAPALARIEELARSGRALAGYIAYEAGLALEVRLMPLAAGRTGADGPLVWMGAFSGWEEMPSAQVPQWLAVHMREDCVSRIGPLEPQMSPGGYAGAFAALAEAIRAGDIYQANFTLPLAGSWRGDPLRLYAALRGAGGAAHGGLIFDGSHWILSLSPELFVATKAGGITARPMKGTRPRGGTAEQDAALAADLAASAKDRAENLMILDLMRNDLSRVAEAGSVKVEAPFAIETYPSVHQMVSTIRARLAPGRNMVDLIRALFPCGSVTGAPKIRAMELIHAHERDPRGVYCGAIGHIDPFPATGTAMTASGNTSGEAAFNVAIRSLRLTPGEGGVGKAVMGVGSAIVADSQALPEWRECLVKGGFVHQPAPEQPTAETGVAQFDMIETMRFTPEEGIPLLDLHLARIAESARALGFVFDRHGVRNAIQALCFEAEGPAKLRLMLARSGASCLEVSDMPPPLPAPAICAVLPLPVDAGDWRLAHKTSDRGLYEAGLAAARAAGAAEVLFLRDDGLVTEGSFTNIFLERDGVLLTPPARLGLLPGVLRRSLLDTGRAVEAELRLEDLAPGFLIGNALRGLMAATLLG